MPGVLHIPVQRMALQRTCSHNKKNRSVAGRARTDHSILGQQLRRWGKLRLCATHLYAGRSSDRLRCNPASVSRARLQDECTNCRRARRSSATRLQCPTIFSQLVHRYYIKLLWVQAPLLVAQSGTSRIVFEPHNNRWLQRS